MFALAGGVASASGIDMEELERCGFWANVNHNGGQQIALLLDDDCVHNPIHEIVARPVQHITRGFVAYVDEGVEVYRYWVEDDNERHEVSKEEYERHN